MTSGLQYMQVADSTIIEVFTNTKHSCTVLSWKN